MLKIIHKKKFPRENKEADEIFENISFVEMESSKLIIFFDKHVLKWPRHYNMPFKDKSLVW
jgi:hypothetical protein